jgi:signal peptide peptidase SppA
MIRALPHIFARTFNVPLAITPARLEPLIAGLRAASFTRRVRANGNGDDEPELPHYPEPPEVEFNGDEEEWDHERVGYSISSGGIAWLPVRDVLVRRDGEIDADSTELESYAHIGTAIRACMADARVKGVLLDVDSCGGESGGLFDLCADIRAASAIKPIWALANDDCLSAAYAIASATSRVWVTRTGSVGSVGVIALHTDQSGFDAANGIRFEYVYAGAHKADFNPHEPLNNDARAELQTEIDRLYAIFVGQVAAYRGMPAEAVAATEAAVFYGENSIAAGLADDIGTFGEVLAAMSDSVSDETTGVSVMNSEPIATPGTPLLTAETLETMTAELTGSIREAKPKVVRLDQVRTATGNVRRDASTIVDLCAVAGYPQLASDFIARETPIAAVRTELLRRKAEASNARQVETIDMTQHDAIAAAGKSELNKAIADRWARQMGKGS